MRKLKNLPKKLGRGVRLIVIGPFIFCYFCAVKALFRKILLPEFNEFSLKKLKYQGEVQKKKIEVTSKTSTPLGKRVISFIKYNSWIEVQMNALKQCN